MIKTISNNYYYYHLCFPVCVVRQNLSEALPTDYERVSRLAVFLEQAEHDTAAYRQLLALTNSKLRSLLCWLEQASLALCQPINYCLTTRHSMVAEERHIVSESRIDDRNFLIGREAGILLDDMISYYEGKLENNMEDLLAR